VHVSLAVALVAFALASGLLGWRLWVGVPGRARVVVIGSFVFTAVSVSLSRLTIDHATSADVFAGASVVYGVMLAVTRGRPEQMLDLWKVGGGPEPSPAVKRSVRAHQWAFCAVIIAGFAFYAWWSIADTLN
jgi:hypothetical protein